MRIKSLQVTGFKSFLETTSFSFDVPITGIVGPNGCGKSNVVDALKWVTGEMSYKQLRGKNSEDLIFAGSERRPPASMMEVALTFDNAEKKAPSQYNQFSEITVLRRIFRDGSSEFGINKTPCRLRDITDLFLDTGIGQSSYSIIEQGKVGAIVSGRPEDRRLMIEEAAGITKYKHRKKAALRKIDSTQQNLLRVTDIIKEIEKQVASLERQAKKAEKFKAAKEAFEVLDLSLFTFDYQALDLERKRLIQAEDQGQLNLSQSESDFLSIASEFETKRLELETIEASFQASQQSLFAQKTKMQDVNHEIESCKQSVVYSEKQLKSDKDKISTLTEDISRLQAKASELEKALSDIEIQKEKVQDQLKAKETVFDQNKGSLSALETKIELLKTDHINQVTALTHAKSKIESLSDNMSYFDENISDIQLELKGFESDIEVAQLQSSEVKTMFDSIAQMCFGFEENQKNIENQLADTESEKLSLSQEIESVEKEFREKESRLHALENFTKNFQGYTKTVQSVMRKHKDDKAFLGIQGVLGQMLEIEQGYEQCVQAVLNDWIESVVVDNTDSSMDLIRYLKQEVKARAMLFTNPSVSGSSPLVDDPRILGKLSKWVRVTSGNYAAVSNRLDQTYVVKGLENMLALSQKYTAVNWVTLDGDYLESTGMLHVGPSGETFGDLEVQAEIQSLTQQLKPLKENLKTKLQKKSELSLQVDQFAKQLEHIVGQIQEESQKRSDLGLKLQKMTDHLGFLDQQKTQKKKSLEELTTKHQQVIKEASELKTEIKSLEKSSKKFEEDIESENTRYQEQKVNFETYQSEIHDYQLNLAAMLEKASSISRETEQTQETFLNSQKEKEHLIKMMGEHQEHIKSQHQKIVDFEASMQSTLSDFETKETDNKELKIKHDELMLVIREFEEKLKTIQGSKDSHVKAVNDVRVLLSEVAVKMEHVQGQVAEMYERDILDVLQNNKVSPENNVMSITPNNINDIRQEREDLKSKVVKFGNVNLAAIDEIGDLRERFTFLSTQKEDLETSLNKLDQAIKTINKTTKEKFEVTFDEVNGRFQKIFPRLFRGGKARLSLTDPDNILDSGVQILAQPPGKKLQNMNLLSGGEKALTAISLLFAIFEFKAPPFCVLDEVDAPLDDANVLRFVAMVKEMSEKTQFIVITHNKGSMQMGQNLYGVTMEEPGVSRTVSVRLDQKNIHDETQIFEAKSVA